MSTYISRGNFTEFKDCVSEQELTEKLLLMWLQLWLYIFSNSVEQIKNQKTKDTFETLISSAISLSHIIHPLLAFRKNENTKAIDIMTAMNRSPPPAFKTNLYVLRGNHPQAEIQSACKSIEIWRLLFFPPIPMAITHMMILEKVT